MLCVLLPSSACKTLIAHKQTPNKIKRMLRNRFLLNPLSTRKHQYPQRQRQNLYLLVLAAQLMTQRDK